MESTITAVIGRKAQQAVPIPTPTPRYTSQPPTLKRSASSELLKIEELGIYMEACARYNRGVREGWSEEELLRMIDSMGGKATRS